MFIKFYRNYLIEYSSTDIVWTYFTIRTNMVDNLGPYKNVLKTQDWTVRYCYRYIHM